MTGLMHRIITDRKGGAAIEFALVFPVIFLFYMAAADGFQAYLAQRNVAHLAATMADITSRNRTVSTAELNDTLGAGVSMMYPLPTLQLQQRISSISADANGAIATDWTVKKDYTPTEAPSVPVGYLRASESVIVTDVIYDYKPTFAFFLPKTIRMTRHAYSRPRLSAKVEKVT
ncbi:TadE/TadG family type IV pilus assembly protein [Phenylobacterium sp.]|uniref:TadE/TadG family type IV pilus assembly protein n=1 Tax=Phenylobacterium sp. TaxID=1871053 RepID=UPI0025E6D2E2|nr:TadE/TadG family type IV pilus assembly protein [Phenylobacterium sp.]